MIAGIVFGGLVVFAVHDVARVHDDDLTGIDGYVSDQLWFVSYCCVCHVSILKFMATLASRIQEENSHS